MNLVRGAFGLAVLSLGGWALVSIFSSGQEVSAARSFTSSRQCQECHAEVYAEWQESWHSKSWVDEDVREMSNDFAIKNCIDCHAPRPVFETGIGERVLPRSSRRHEGVDCISCHLLPDGRVAGTIENPSAPCRPTVRRELQRPEFCSGCHNQHLTVDQWRETPFPEQGQDCLECHMPYRDGDPNKGRDHTSHGGHDMELVRTAADLRGSRDGDGWMLEVENIGAGHHFPTDERSRAADVFWRPLAADGATGEGRWHHLYRIRSPYRYETDIPDTLLPYGETREIRLDDPAAANGAQVGLFYNLRPVYLDPETAEPLPLDQVEDPRPDANLVKEIFLRP